MRRRTLIAAGAAGLAGLLVPTGLALPAGAQRPRPFTHSLGVGIYAGGISFPEGEHNVYYATEPGKGKLRIEPRARHWGEVDLIAQIEVFVTVEGGLREQQWAQQWHVGPYSHRAGQDSELAQIEQAYWVGTGDGYLPDAERDVWYEVYFQGQLGTQDSAPVFVHEVEVHVKAA